MTLKSRPREGDTCQSIYPFATDKIINSNVFVPWLLREWIGQWVNIAYIRSNCEIIAASELAGDWWLMVVGTRSTEKGDYVGYDWYKDDTNRHRNVTILQQYLTIIHKSTHISPGWKHWMRTMSSHVPIKLGYDCLKFKRHCIQFCWIYHSKCYTNASKYQVNSYESQKYWVKSQNLHLQNMWKYACRWIKFNQFLSLTLFFYKVTLPNVGC